MTRRRIIRAALYVTIPALPVVTLPWITDFAEIIGFAFRIATAILLAYLWKTSPRLSGFKLALNRIALTGFALEALFLILNSIRVFTYDAAIESRSKWQTTVFYNVIEIQTPILWTGVALAAIFIIVLIAFGITTAVRHHRTARSLQASNV